MKPVPWSKRANEFHATTMTKARQASSHLARVRERAVSNNDMAVIAELIQAELLVRDIERAGIYAKTNMEET